MLSRRAAAADIPGVVAAAAEPISPELVLVCPELRDEALARLPDVGPERLARVVDPPRRGAALRETAADLAHLLVLGGTAFLASGAVTLALTLAADATR